MSEESSKTIFNNFSDFLSKKQSFILNKSDIHIIADFDSTLTKYIYQNGHTISTYSALYSFLGNDYRNQQNNLFHKFYPIEHDINISPEDKLIHVEEWFEKALNLIIEQNIFKHNLPEIVSTCSIELKKGCDELFSLLAKHDIPITIFSAGLGDIVREVLQQRGLLFPNISIISNMMKFDKNGKITRFQNHIVHSLNKGKFNGNFISLNRKYVILLGDHINDTDMSSQVDFKYQIAIGFLNSIGHIETDKLNIFKSKYDVVLVKEHDSLDFVLNLCQNILKD